MSFTDEQIAALKAPLAREHVKEREQAGRKLSYIEGWTAIAEANRIFGFDAWDRETVECRCVVEREAKIGRPPNQVWALGLAGWGSPERSRTTCSRSTRPGLPRAGPH